MYNSRPRYPTYRSGNYSPDFSVPDNYSGNAFRSGVHESEITLEGESNTDMADVNIAENTDGMENAEVSVDFDNPDDSPKADESIETMGKVNEGEERRVKEKGGFGFDIGKLFNGGIGFEEILIIGLMLLVGKDGGNEDIIILLALLLFIG